VLSGLPLRPPQAHLHAAQRKIFFGKDDQPGGHSIAGWARFHCFDRIRLWFHNGGTPATSDDLAENTIILGEPFYKRLALIGPSQTESCRCFAEEPGG
jgi:hypothetical protein